MKRVLSIFLVVLLFIGCYCTSATAISTDIYIYDVNYPSCVFQGNTFSVYGTVYSDYGLTSVTVGIYGTDGRTKYEYNGNPNRDNYFDVHDADSAMAFSKLKTGNYIYKITASSSARKNVVLLNKSFKVSDRKAPSSYLERLDESWAVLDMSSHQEDVWSWQSIKDRYDAVIFRIGYRGQVYHNNMAEDTYFKTYYDGAKAWGIPVGCYFYSVAWTVDEAIEEANFVINTLKKYNCQLELPVFFDIEDDTQTTLGRTVCTEMTRAFCETLEANGYYPGFYSYRNFFYDNMYMNQLLDYTVWVAQYADSCDYSGPYEIWQYTDSHYAGFVYGNVDESACYYNYPKYIKENGLNGFPKQEQQKFQIIKDKPGAPGINYSDTIIYTRAQNFTTDDFTSTFIEKSSDVTVNYSDTYWGKVATGTKLTAKSRLKTIADYTISLMGDVDCDAKVTSNDALLVLQYVVGQKKLSDIQKISADDNYNSVIDSTDALGILQTVVGAY